MQLILAFFNNKNFFYTGPLKILFYETYVETASYTPVFLLPSESTD